MAGKQPKNSRKNPAAHLEDTQFKPGQSGNPSGRPVGSVSLVTVLQRKLREAPERAETIVDNLLSLGEAKDAKALHAIAELFDRIDGKAVQTVRTPDGVGAIFIGQPGEQAPETPEERAERLKLKPTNRATATNGNGNGNGNGKH